MILKNKEVLVPSITFSATAASALYCGLKPKFVDIRKEDLTIDFEDIKKNIPKLCSINLCTYGWSSSPNGKIRPWQRKKLFLIEDSAESCGSIYKGKS